jgi:hypothetical protein
MAQDVSRLRPRVLDEPQVQVLVRAAGLSLRGSLLEPDPTQSTSLTTDVVHPTNRRASVKINPSNRPYLASARLGTLLGGTIAALAFGSTLAAAQTKIPDAMRNQAMSVAQICRSDYDRLCANVQPGGGRILACLSANLQNLSAPCRAAMPEANSLASRAAAAGVMPK